MRLTRYVVCSFGGILLGLAAGCSDSTPTDSLARVPVWGTVSLNGTPLTQGTVQFEPAPGTKGVTAVGEVSDGKFSIEKTIGPVPGKYLVKISSRPGAKLKAGEAPGGVPKPDPEMVPPQYNTKSKLEEEVKAGGSSFEFALGK
jgi:hypothetical protein